MEITSLPLLLLDNASLSNILNKGTYAFDLISFDEAKGIVESYEEDGVLRCFSGADLEKIVYEYLGIENQHFEYKDVRDMEVNQHAIAFKLYVTPSGTQPIILTEHKTEAKKIQNIYVQCQYIHRID